MHTATTTAQRDILSVSQLNKKVRQLLETHLSLLWVEGEISNLTRHSSGHWYFSLKDSAAQISCAMFRNRNSQVRFVPERGQQVLVRARASLYEPRGNYQLIVEHMEEAGHGALQRAFEELKAKLAAEGLFDPERKQPLPGLPEHIAVITSPTGAAVRDILTVLARRFPATPVSVIPVTVQGPEAAPAIINAIGLAHKHPAIDTIILGRGGGSLEDLWAFNEETVARAIAASRIPIVSAVGHEVDFTIADFVADVRAPTPSAAAELVSPDGGDWLQTYQGYEVLLTQAMQRQIDTARRHLDHLRTRLRHPGERLQSRAQHLDHLEMRLIKSMGAVLQRQAANLQQLALRQQRLHPEGLIDNYQQRLQHLRSRLQTRTQTLLQQQRQRLAAASQLLQSVSPLNVLARGYAIVSDKQGGLVRDAARMQPGDEVTARLSQGQLVCEVKATR
ncbi:exodeoxyribonuclease VII large subunit [Exilibacterium tricleocarpae]|uniref:Exodeoxyribonuclease 7 large subunit n=1 Tax=Exilibacterium tricleocarpae TaxID=2591008 RepID=A0A545U8H3_9GAMM|nr:exodeoxyribonuclease VII large subunit [Exilibacterium tricleocarpae]